MCEVVQFFFAQLRTWTTHRHRSWNVPIAHETYELVKCTNPAIATRQSVQNEKRPFQKNCYRMAKTCKNVHIMHVRHTEKHVGVLQTAEKFSKLAKGFRSKTNHLNLSELVCLNSEHDWTNPKDNSVKILWPIQTQQGNQYRQNYVTVAYVWWEQMNQHTVDLGFIQSRAEVTTVFTNVDKWIMAVFVNGLGINKRKDRRKGTTKNMQNPTALSGPQRQKIKW